METGRSAAVVRSSISTLLLSHAAWSFFILRNFLPLLLFKRNQPL